MIKAARETPEGLEIGVDQRVAGSKESKGPESTWRDTEDGWLSAM